jgi:hypothetical protein
MSPRKPLLQTPCRRKKKRKSIKYIDSPPNPPCPGAGVPGYANTVSLLSGAKRYSPSPPSSSSPLVEGVLEEEEGPPVRITVGGEGGVSKVSKRGWK